MGSTRVGSVVRKRRPSSSSGENRELKKHIRGMQREEAGIFQGMTTLEGPSTLRSAKGGPINQALGQTYGGAYMGRGPGQKKALKYKVAAKDLKVELSLKNMREIIAEIYASKEKFDIKCAHARLPRETMEQHMYTLFWQKYGLRKLIVAYATATINGIAKYEEQENDVKVFGKILRNEVDE